MSDKIAVLNGGIIEQIGEPKEIYQNPESAFVSDFIGETNAFDGVIQDVHNDYVTVNCESRHFKVKASDFAEREFVNVSIRPHKIQSMVWQGLLSRRMEQERFV